MGDDYKCVPYITYTNQSDESIKEYAKFIGIDPVKDPDLLYIAQQGLSAPLPKGWLFYQNKHNPDDFFFYNENTGESISDHPSDTFYKNLAKEKLEEKYNKSSKKEESENKNNHSPQKEENVWDYTSDEPPTLKSFYSNLNKKEEEPISKHHKSHSKHKSKDPDEYNSQENGNKINNDQFIILQKEYQDKKDELERNHQKMIENLKNEQQKEENLLKAIQARRISKENELKTIEAELSTAKIQQKSQVENFDRIQSLHKKSIEELNKANLEEIEQIKQYHLTQKDQLIKENKIEIKNMKKQLKNKILQMRAKHEKKLAEIRTKAANHLEKYMTNNQENVNILDKYDEYTKNELDKKKREFECQLSKLITLHSEEIAKKNSEYIQFVGQLELIKQKCIDDINKTKEKAEIEKRNIIKKMQKSISNAKRKEINEKTKNFVHQTTKIVSIKNNSNHVVKLKRSSPQSLSIIDENEDLDEKINKKKVHQKFDVSNSHKIDVLLSNLKAQLNEVKSLIKKENQTANKSTFDFLQQMFVMTRNLQNSIAELEMRHYSVISAMNSMHNRVENIPQPTHIIVTPPMTPPNYYAYKYPVYQKEKFYKRERNVYEFE